MTYVMVTCGSPGCRCWFGVLSCEGLEKRRKSGEDSALTLSSGDATNLSPLTALRFLVASCYC